ncbi:MAG: OB-fold nucleic acid binding domain-containing protein, partial [Actinomycetes bacterium]
EMLGLYVSDHPLHGAETLLAQLTDRSIAAVLMDERADGSVATVGGLVTGVQRKTTKQGSAWAIVTLEDLEGSVDVMVFPQTYASVGTLLVDDAVVVVRARVDRSDDDGVRLVALEVTQPDMSEAVRGPVRLTMAASRCIPPLVDRLKEVLAAHPGTNEVHLHLTGGAKTTVLRLDDRLRVTPSPALHGDLKALLGPACLG